MVTGTPDVKTEFGVWVAIIALCLSAIAHQRIAQNELDADKPILPIRVIGVGAIIAALILPHFFKSNDASAKPLPYTKAATASQVQSHTHKPLESETLDASFERPIEIEPLRSADTDHIGGASCLAVDLSGSAIFVSDGTAFIRANGRLISLIEQDGMIGGDAMNSRGGSVIVTFKPRAGETIFLEEGISKPMTMTVFSGGEQNSIDVWRECGA